MPTIRNGCIGDAAAIATLAGELGYAATVAQMRERLAAVERASSDCVLVAEIAERGVAGWLHVALLAHLTADAEAEILGLVVAAASRGTGVGAELLRSAEQWARAHGARRLTVRSRVERERAHRFYERAGYRRIKTQAVFVKPLDD